MHKCFILIIIRYNSYHKFVIVVLANCIATAAATTTLGHLTMLKASSSGSQLRRDGGVVAVVDGVVHLERVQRLGRLAADGAFELDAGVQVQISYVGLENV